MALNPNIILQGQQPQLAQPNPVDQYSKALQLKGLLTQNQIQQQSLSDDQSQRQALSESGGDPSAYLKALATGGNYKAYQATLKAQQDQQKAQADIGKTQSDTKHREKETQNLGIAQYRDAVTNVNSPQDAIALITQQHKDGLLPGGDQQYQGAVQAIQQAGQDPMLFDQWKKQYALGATKYIETNKPTYQTSNLGGKTVTTALPGLGGAPTMVNSQANSVSPDASLQASTTMRGQNMVDARQREANTMNMSKPFEVSAPDGSKVLVQQDKQGNITPVQGYLPKASAAKPLTDSQSKAALFGSRMQASGDILDQLSQQGINKSIPGSQLGYGVGAVVNALSPADFQKLDQAKRDFVNATLRRESGAAIADSEFENANKQYFPQQGDSKAVIEQKRQNRQIATRGVQAEIPNEQRAGLVSQIIGDQTGPQKGGMATPIKTADDYAKLPSGATYIDPSGQTRRKP